VVEHRRRTGLSNALLQQAPAVVVVGLFVVSGLVTERILGRPNFFQVHFYSPRLLAGVILYMPLLAFYHATRSVFVERRGVRDWRTWRAFGERYFSLERVLPAVVLLGLLGPLMSTYVSYKALIPEISPFSWDPAFMNLDSWLHAGRQPWTLLFPLFGSPSMVRFLDYVYLMWFPVLVMTVVWLAWSGRDPLRSQFFLTYALTWIVLGVFLALALSSAGPCYYSEVVGTPSTYDELMAHLMDIDRTRPLSALDIQGILWRDYAGLAENAIEGISAMPSLHVAMATLLILLYSRIHMLAGVAAGVFASLIFLGSIMLGWHYAVDGYVSAAVVVPLWWISGRVQAAVEGAREA